MGELLGIPPSLFTSSGWGALGIFVILLGFLFSKGTIKTGAEYARALAESKVNFDARTNDLKEFFQGRLADKDSIIEDKTATNKFLMETVEVLEDQLAEMVRANETSEHVIRAIQEAAQMSSGGPS